MGGPMTHERSDGDRRLRATEDAPSRRVREQRTPVRDITLRSSKHRLRPARFQAAMPGASLRESIARTSPVYRIALRPLSRHQPALRTPDSRAEGGGIADPDGLGGLSSFAPQQVLRPLDRSCVDLFKRDHFRGVLAARKALRPASVILYSG